MVQRLGGFNPGIQNDPSQGQSVNPSASQQAGNNDQFEIENKQVQAFSVVKPPENGLPFGADPRVIDALKAQQAKDQSSIDKAQEHVNSAHTALDMAYGTLGAQIGMGTIMAIMTFGATVPDSAIQLALAVHAVTKAQKAVELTEAVKTVAVCKKKITDATLDIELYAGSGDTDRLLEKTKARKGLVKDYHQAVDRELKLVQEMGIDISAKPETREELKGDIKEAAAAGDMDALVTKGNQLQKTRNPDGNNETESATDESDEEGESGLEQAEHVVGAFTNVAMLTQRYWQEPLKNAVKSFFFGGGEAAVAGEAAGSTVGIVSAESAILGTTAIATTATALAAAAMTSVAVADAVVGGTSAAMGIAAVI